MKKRYIKDMHIYLYVDTLTMKKKNGVSSNDFF